MELCSTPYYQAVVDRTGHKGRLMFKVKNPKEQILFGSTNVGGNWPRSISPKSSHLHTIFKVTVEVDWQSAP